MLALYSRVPKVGEKGYTHNLENGFSKVRFASVPGWDDRRDLIRVRLRIGVIMRCLVGMVVGILLGWGVGALVGFSVGWDVGA